MKKYIITEEQLKKISHFSKLNEEISTSNDGKLIIDGNKYDVEIDSSKYTGKVNVKYIEQLTDGSFKIKVETDTWIPMSATEILSKQRAINIKNQVPKSKIVSAEKDKPTITLIKTKD